LHRFDSGPANDEEYLHLREIESICRLDHEAAFKSGETGLIRDLALTVVSDIQDSYGA
jgi:hypothetical protein